MTSLVALFDYSGDATSTLTFKQGERFTLVNKDNADWWQVDYKGTPGFVPSTYVKVAEDHAPVPSMPAPAPPTQAAAAAAAGAVNIAELPLPDTALLAATSIAAASASGDTDDLDALDALDKALDAQREQFDAAIADDDDDEISTPLSSTNSPLPAAVPATAAAASASLANKGFQGRRSVSTENFQATTALPENWVEATDANGKTYYYNRVTKQTSWSRPLDRPLPENWKAVADASGKTYYYNSVTRETSWSFPAGAPAPSTAPGAASTTTTAAASAAAAPVTAAAAAASSQPVSRGPPPPAMVSAPVGGSHGPPPATKKKPVGLPGAAPAGGAPAPTSSSAVPQSLVAPPPAIPAAPTSTSPTPPRKPERPVTMIVNPNVPVTPLPPVNWDSQQPPHPPASAPAPAPAPAPHAPDAGVAGPPKPSAKPKMVPPPPPGGKPTHARTPSSDLTANGALPPPPVDDEDFMPPPPIPADLPGSPALSASQRSMSMTGLDSPAVSASSSAFAFEDLGMEKAEEVKSIDPNTVAVEGYVSKKNVLEFGRPSKMRGWITYYVMLLGTRLIFFKDHKVILKAKKNGTALRPLGTVDLIGATADIAYGYTKKKNVFSVSTRNGTQFYMQTDAATAMMNWITRIQTVLKSFSGETVETVSQQMSRSSISQTPPKKKVEDDKKKKLEDEKKKKLEDDKAKKAQEKAAKDQKKKPAAPGGTLRSRMSTAELETIDSTEGEEKKTKIKKRLLFFFSHRPTMENLRDEGLIQDPYFGGTLSKICEKENLEVPSFVQQCVENIEQRGLDIVGIYRLSGSSTLIQKIRYKINSDEPLDFADPICEDVNTVTGALKLFFRELSEPVIPFDSFDACIAAIKQGDIKAKVEGLKNAVNEFPAVNFNTLRFMVKHLAKVCERGETNKMMPQNVGIVFGPTLMKAREETMEIVVNMGLQTNVIEVMVGHHKEIFP
ncbi:rho GTPase-activating protein 15 [Capsaspora owczarzaki ATCC 30864]|uniref:Rho GTPase-activating protein 15 n=1 Tax=Capsaspora owczarzaki (strain ATCC 30864) TaxID=595528 RepID=A0A0D2VF83_CAPO3|nr:rho GTPase-activating protein 15 [Capsaspora owczarzaki ATCC 30864]KJE88377.1 rho GTPase-activating protein 15 [Capsaspora owczarzaki ATCC 30864]|eukprot:XP_004364910.1 rho GTPase-activating protein 15 [Capsaspora owczarzaki ATCC 30864]